jgi:hypothetical protein
VILLTQANTPAIQAIASAGGTIGTGSSQSFQELQGFSLLKLNQKVLLF